MEQLLIDIKKQCPVIKDFVLKLFPDPNTRLLTGIYKISFKEDKKEERILAVLFKISLVGKQNLEKVFTEGFIIIFMI